MMKRRKARPRPVLAGAAVFLLLVASGCVVAPGATSPVLLTTGFEQESVTPLNDGRRDDITLTFTSGRSGPVPIHYEAGTYADRFAQVIDDPTSGGDGNRVLQFWMKNAAVPGGSPGQFKGRVQLTYGGLSSFTDVFQRYRMYLHPDLAHYRSYPDANRWFMVTELRSGAEGEPQFRIVIDVFKDAGVGAPLHFLVAGSKRIGGAPHQGIWQTVWAQQNTDLEVPIGEWITMEIGYRLGDASTGRVHVAVQPDSAPSKTVIADVKNWTYHPDAPQPVPLHSSQPLKLYTSDDIIDHIRDRGGVAQVLWDDLEVRG